MYMPNTLSAGLDDLEREMVTEALKSSRGNMTKAASAIGITERIMGLRVRKHGLDSRKYKLRV